VSWHYVAVTLILVDGSSGSGKSAVLAELRARGFEAYGTDEDNFALWHDKVTDNYDEIDQEAFASAGQRTPEFLERFEWALVRERVAELAASAKDRLVFLCGGGRLFDCWELFDAVLILSAPLEVVLARIDERAGNDFGRSEVERVWVAVRHAQMEQSYRASGATLIDSSRSLALVVDEVVASSRKFPG